jgi:hypothetical protein
MYDIIIDTTSQFAMFQPVEVGRDPRHLKDFEGVELGKPTGIFFFDASKALMLMIPWQNVNTVEFKSIL